MAQQMRQGESFNITRLTSLKSFCADPQTAAQFCLYLAKRIQQRMLQNQHPESISPADWQTYQQFAKEAIAQIEAYLQEPAQEKKKRLAELMTKARAVNNQYKNTSWGTVRVIQCSEVLLIEKALEAVIKPQESQYWGYQVAREYAERYNSYFGNGLPPESAPFIEEIAIFWCQYYFSVPLTEWSGFAKKRPSAKVRSDSSSP